MKGDEENIFIVKFVSRKNGIRTANFKTFIR